MFFFLLITISVATAGTGMVLASESRTLVGSASYLKSLLVDDEMMRPVAEFHWLGSVLSVFFSALN